MKLHEKEEIRRGLSDSEAELSRREHGTNVLSRKKGKSFVKRFVSNLNDPVIRILLGALLIHLITVFQNGDWIETAGIGCAVFLATLISTLSEHTSERAFHRLNREGQSLRCRVRRSGRIKELPITQVAVGDVVLLEAGEQIPADGLILSGKLRTDQSAMTGESNEVEKYPLETLPNKGSPSSPATLFRGCLVTSGNGEMLVTEVGDATFLGEISKEVQIDPRDSPLKRRLSKLAKQISLLGYLAAVLIALIYLFNVFVLDSGMRREIIFLKLCNSGYLLTHLFRAFTLALTVIVVAVPEGLPMMIAVVLSANVRRMVKDHVLVRKPVGIEAAGSMNILFTDKTGTLTEGKMRVEKLLLPDGRSMSLADLFRQGGKTATYFSLSMRFGNGCNVGSDEHGNRVALGGNATARALLEATLSFPEPVGWRTLSQLPFDSTRKFSAVTLGGKEELTLVLGAPEILFPHIRHQMTSRETLAPFSKVAVQEQLTASTRQGNRVLALAVAEHAIPAASLFTHKMPSLIYLGAFSLCDPLRSQAKQAVRDLHGAGIHVVMITGDNKETAESIAHACGILNSKTNLALSGEELASLSDTRLRDLLPRLGVIARALPTDKSRLVRISQEAGMVVGMTGDGINDAPALRHADVGFSMGSGTQVAKDAGDVIILNNDLSTIVRAVLYGRSIFKSIRKFITLQLTMNLCAVGVSMICPLLGIDTPVTVVQMLWINIIMDTLGGLAFAGEAPLAEYLLEPPKKRDEPILNRYMAFRILFEGGFTVGLCLYFLKSPTMIALFREHEGRLYLLTAFFALFIFSSVFNCFNARTDRLKLTAGLSKNPIFILIMCVILFIQILFIYLGGSVLRTAPLLPRELICTFLFSLAVFPADALCKALWRLFEKKSGY